MKLLLIAATTIASLAMASCSVNQYCLNCEKGDGGTGDGGNGDAKDGGNVDAPDASACTPTNGGVEVCDGVDNDCNGTVDDHIQEMGAACNNNGGLAQTGDAPLVGECVGSHVTGCHVTATGPHVICSAPPMPEVCDMKDNNCDGRTDEGDPGGGVACGTNAGECTAGVMHCNPSNGHVECVGAIGSVGGQPEVCDGKDNDCNGMIDDGIGSLGSCGGPNVGACHTGTLMCMGGGTVCVGSQGPTFETCDNIDNDCDGTIDNGFDKLHDPQNCGTCGHVCSAPNAVSGCSPGGCTIASCFPGFHDLNNPSPPLADADGCEYACQVDGAEVCDGVDNDCDGNVDNGLTAPPGLCTQVGACSGAVAMCTGAGGWKCMWPADVSTDASGNIIPETKCDGKDNDCNGRIDDNQPNLNQACHDSGVGVCQGTGKFTCNPANLNGPAVCTITTPGATASAETCDGKDNDCNGVVDDGMATGNMPGQNWVTIPGQTTQIMKYEAARPDASSSAQGLSSAGACSKAGVQPWTNLTYPQAVAACTAVGARLCTESEWQAMCAVEITTSTTYPAPAPQGAGYLIIEAENAKTYAPGTPTDGVVRNWTLESTLTGFQGTGYMRAAPNRTNNLTIAVGNIATQSPRMDFDIDFGSTAADYSIWVRMSAGSGNDNSIYLALPGFTTTAMNSVTNDTWSWVGLTGFNALTGVKTLSIYMREDGIKVDAIAITRTSVPPDGYNPDANRSWSFQSNPTVFQNGICNSQEYDTDAATAGNQDDILVTGSLGSCFANGPTTNDAFDMSGNVKEWTKARAAGQNPIRGGASNSTPDGVSCQLNFTSADDTFFFQNVGFRCCR